MGLLCSKTLNNLIKNDKNRNINLSINRKNNKYIFYQNANKFFIYLQNKSFTAAYQIGVFQQTE